MTTVRVAVPPGIGDSLWAIAKMQSMMSSYPAGSKLHVSVCSGEPKRSAEFIDRFDFVDSVTYTHWQCVEADSLLPDGRVNYAQTGRNWHHEYDWILVPNATLERGDRLEDWQPDWSVNWRVMDHWKFSGAEISAAISLQRGLGRYAVFYASSQTNNTTAGHNRNGIWKLTDWLQLVRGLQATGLAAVLVGAEYDRSYADALRDAGVIFDADLVGQMSIGETLAAIRLSAIGVYFQSGLGVVSTYFGVPTAMWWRQHGDSIIPDGYQTFDERMATAWVPPRMLEDGYYLPLYYGRETAGQVVEMIASKGWCCR